MWAASPWPSSTICARRRHPQTHGMVERFNGRISDVLKQTSFESAAHLEQTLLAYLQTYNHRNPQHTLDHQTPMQAL